MPQESPIPYSDLDLATAPKTNLYAFFRHFQRSSTAKCLETPGYFRWRTTLPHPWFNGILVSKPPDAGAGKLIETTKSYFMKQDVGAFTWWLNGEATGADWASLLKPRGFHLDANTPGMVASLTHLPTLPPAPKNFTTKSVTNLEEFKTWTRTFIPGYGLMDFIAPLFYDFGLSLGLNLPFRYYLGCLDGVPVATSTLYLSPGVAGIYNVATLPQARGQGLGAAITLAPLLEARRMGYAVGALQSSEMGYRVYQRLGFRTVCQMEHFFCSLENPLA